MCYKFEAQEEEEEIITILCKHKHGSIYFRLNVIFIKQHPLSMWDFQPSLRLRIFSALVGDFSEKLARAEKKEKRFEIFSEVKGSESFRRSKVLRGEAENVGREVDARLWHLGREEENELW